MAISLGRLTLFSDKPKKLQGIIADGQQGSDGAVYLLKSESLGVEAMDKSKL